MPESGTSPEIKALLSIGLALALYAWWLSHRQARRFRDFADWVEDTYPQRWRALSRWSRRLYRTGCVEQLRRRGLAGDPQFMARYRQDKPVRWPQVAAALASLATIGLVAAGIEYLGWAF